MSRSFGPLDTRADFQAALTRSLDYAASDAFWEPTLRPGVQRQLTAIAAWTHQGRTPRLAERDAVSLSWSIARAREGIPMVEPPDWIERIELTSHVSWYFACWPTDDETGRTARYYGASCRPRVPTADELRAVADVVLDVVDATGLAATERPAEDAFRSTQPMFRDRMSTPTWTRWVLVPRLQAMGRGELPPPPNSQLTTLCMSLAADVALWPLLDALAGVDDLFRRAMKNHEP